MTVLAEKYDLEPGQSAAARPVGHPVKYAGRQRRLATGRVGVAPVTRIHPASGAIVRLTPSAARACHVEPRHQELRLTRRGVAVLTLALGVLLSTAVAVIVLQFLSISDAPLESTVGRVVVAAVR